MKYFLTVILNAVVTFIYCQPGNLISFADSKIKPNIRICSGEKQQAEDIDWHDMNYSKDLRTFNDRCRSDILASIKTENASTACHAVVTILNTCGGGCGGPNGGIGEGESIFKTKILLSKPSQDSAKYVIDFTVGSKYKLGESAGQMKINLIGLGHNFSFNAGGMDNSNHSFNIPNIDPGIYDLTFSLPKVSRGCKNSPNGTIVFSEFLSTLTIDIYLK